MADARKERWRAHREGRREEFVEATIRAVARYGPDAGMDEIAAEAGVTKPVLYRHFADKADLYLAVGNRATDILMSSIVPALAEDAPIFERIRRAVGCYVGFVDDYRELYRFLVLRPNPTKRDLVQEDKSKIAEVLTELLAAYLTLFRMDPVVAGPSAHGIVGLVQGAVEWWLDHPGEMTRQQLTDHLTTLIWHGIDGVLRTGGVTLDPHKPVSSFAAQLRLIVGGAE
ncbi:MAG TPA: TetR/AcrR family transcriptional regulator [Pseudonocardiaceae bacterium]|nr:TetR/AcrR family transcriptional regulator [Pseudonocardiaceae bacterium]